MAFTYPAARRGDIVDDYHGTKVADPYRWLENPDTEETQSFIEAQNQLSFPYLDGLPERQALRNRMDGSSPFKASMNHIQSGATDGIRIFRSAKSGKHSRANMQRWNTAASDGHIKNLSQPLNCFAILFDTRAPTPARIRRRDWGIK